jgi:exosome complex component RRP43
MDARSSTLADPTSFEEPLLDTTLSIVVDDDNELISVNQVGLGSTSQDVLLACVSAAKTRRSLLGKQIYNS